MTKKGEEKKAVEFLREISKLELLDLLAIGNMLEVKEVDPFDYGEYNIGDKFSCRMPKKDVVKNYKVTVEETKDRKYNNILNFIFFINAFAFAYFAAVIIVHIGEKIK